MAFLIAYNQNKELLGKNGLVPANQFMDRIYEQYKKTSKNQSLTEELMVKFSVFIKLPTVFWFFNWSDNIDQLLEITSLVGITLSVLVFLMGAANSFIMFILWVLYHSIVNIGQNWYSFGWESQLLESGFLAIFLVPFFTSRLINAKSEPSFIVILLYRWLIVRIMLGAVSFYLNS